MGILVREHRDFFFYIRWLSRPLIFRYKVTAGGADGKRSPPAWLHEKIRQPSAICAKSGIPDFFICHTCLTPPVPPVLNGIEKISRT